MLESHALNGRERLMRIFREGCGQAGSETGGWKSKEMLHPSYKPVYDLAMEVSDIVASASAGLISVGTKCTNKNLFQLKTSLFRRQLD